MDEIVDSSSLVLVALLSPLSLDSRVRAVNPFSVIESEEGIYIKGILTAHDGLARPCPPHFIRQRI